MTDDSKKKNKGGRPRKYPSDIARPTITFRVRSGALDQLKASAETRELSLSEEVERRINESLESEGDISGENMSVATALAYLLETCDAKAEERKMGPSDESAYKFARAQSFLSAMFEAPDDGKWDKLTPESVIKAYQLGLAEEEQSRRTIQGAADIGE